MIANEASNQGLSVTVKRIADTTIAMIEASLAAGHKRIILTRAQAAAVMMVYRRLSPPLRVVPPPAADNWEQDDA